MVCALSMLMAAWVEHRRLVMFHEGEFHRSTEPDLHHIRVVDMSVFWQIPQVRWLLHFSSHAGAIQGMRICSASRGQMLILGWYHHGCEFVAMLSRGCFLLQYLLVGLSEVRLLFSFVAPDELCSVGHSVRTHDTTACLHVRQAKCSHALVDRQCTADMRSLSVRQNVLLSRPCRSWRPSGSWSSSTTRRQW